MLVAFGDPQSAARSGAGRVIGVIGVRCDNRFFPSNGWRDFPIIILGWWASSIVSFLSNSETEVELPFMDGPYRLRVGLGDSGYFVQLCDSDACVQCYSVVLSDIIAFAESVQRLAIDWMDIGVKLDPLGVDNLRLKKSCESLNIILRRLADQ